MEPTNRLLEVSWGSVLFPQMLFSSLHASPLLSALFLMLLSGHVSAHLPSSCSQPKARSPEQGTEVRVEEVDRQGEESESGRGPDPAPSLWRSPSRPLLFPPRS